MKIPESSDYVNHKDGLAAYAVALQNHINYLIKTQDSKLLEAFEAGQQWAVDANKGNVPIAFAEWILKTK